MEEGGFEHIMYPSFLSNFSGIRLFKTGPAVRNEVLPTVFVSIAF